MMKPLPLHKAFMLLEPGPVTLVVTAPRRGRPNVMTMTWHLVLDFTPRFGCVIGPWDYTCAALRATRECVIAIPTVDLAGKVVDIGSCSGRDTDKFAKFGLATAPAATVRAPLLAGCLANIECRVVEEIKRHHIFILDATRAWVDPARQERRTFHANGDGTFVTDGRTLNLKKRMLKLPPGLND